MNQSSNPIHLWMIPSFWTNHYGDWIHIAPFLLGWWSSQFQWLYDRYAALCHAFIFLFVNAGESCESYLKLLCVRVSNRLRDSWVSESFQSWQSHQHVDLHGGCDFSPCESGALWVLTRHRYTTGYDFINRKINSVMFILFWLQKLWMCVHEIIREMHAQNLLSFSTHTHRYTHLVILLQWAFCVKWGFSERSCEFY